MASKHLAALAIFAILLPAVAMATEFTVGDDQGWTINFDYVAWAKDKVFHVGDKLVFKYTAGRHNVFKVNGTAFTNCTIPPANEALTTGNDVITLATPGRKWYICGVNDHCANYGQKLAITVLEAWVSPASAPPPPQHQLPPPPQRQPPPPPQHQPPPPPQQQHPVLLMGSRCLGISC
ncbi:hypothetical protein AAG906_031276 [Vitis piasezkii]